MLTPYIAQRNSQTNPRTEGQCYSRLCTVGAETEVQSLCHDRTAKTNVLVSSVTYRKGYKEVRIEKRFILQIFNRCIVILLCRRVYVGSTTDVCRRDL